MNKRRALYKTLASLREQLVLVRAKYRRENEQHLKTCSELKQEIKNFQSNQTAYQEEVKEISSLRNKINKILASEFVTEEERKKFQIKFTAKHKAPEDSVARLTSNKSYSSKRVHKLAQEMLEIKRQIGEVRKEILETKPVTKSYEGTN